MNFRTLLATAVTGLCSAGGDAYAACQIRGGMFYPAQNDTVHYSAAVSGDGTCDRSFTTRGLQFTGIKIAARPSNGSLSVSGVSSFAYRARAGYKGSDSFTVQACGTGRQGSGCSTLVYQVTVQ